MIKGVKRKEEINSENEKGHYIVWSNFYFSISIFSSGFSNRNKVLFGSFNIRYILSNYIITNEDSLT